MRAIGLFCIVLGFFLLHCQAPDCRTGMRACGGAIVLVCTAKGVWQEEAICPAGSTCIRGACKPGVVVVPDGSAADASGPDNPLMEGASCAVGATKCLDQQRHAQCVAGQWQAGTCSAAQRCESGRCVEDTQCQEGARRCQDAAHAARCEGGVWQPTTCPSGQSCVGGACLADACQEGSRRCDDATTRAQCQAGKWTPLPCQTGTSCKDGQCQATPQCTEGQTRCPNPSTQETCKAGQWQAQPCPTGQGCDATRCQPASNPTACASPCSAGQICRLGQCAGWSTTYRKIPFEGNQTDRDPPTHADLNPRLRGWQKISGQAKALVDYNGATDGNAPKIFGMFSSGKFPGIVENYQAGEWDWSKNAKRGWITSTYWKVHYVGFKTTPGEPISIPSRQPIIYTNANALVLYVEQDSITFVYTREDTVANGYAVHVIGVHIAEDLKRLYQQTASRNSKELPALENGKPFGVAIGTEVLVSIRDRGAFMDPRARKDWW